MKERFGAQNPRSMMFRSLIGGGGSGFTVQEPENNIVRGAYYSLAAALSGCQTSALPTYDEAYTIPSPKAQLIALRTMQICAEETGVADTVDPLAGSYFVEALTNEMEARIVAEMERVERMGGIVEGVRSGAIQAEVARQAYRFEQMMLSGEYPKVGVNRHVAPDATRESGDAIELYAFDPEVAKAQIARLERLRREREQGAVDRTLARLRDAARGRDSLMPPILEAVRGYATLGEMAGALRDVWGEHKEPTAF
jgi:methylmalonyl-CoA mutase, N-terminal domain